MQPDHDPACRSCAYPTEDLLHLFNCPATAEACLALQRCLSLYQPNISPQQTLLLDLVVDPSVEFPVVWLISTTLMFIWTVRISKKNCRMFEVRADLEARVNFLRRGKKFQNEAVLLKTMIESFF